MTSAQEVLDHPELHINPVTDPKPDDSDINELLHFHLSDDDISILALKVYGITRRAIIQNIRSVVLDCVIHDSISETPTITLRVHDPEWQLLNSGALDHTIDINPGNIPHRWYRLDAVDVNDDELSLTFITRNAAYLQVHKRPYKISRNKVTRAEFILTLLHHIKKEKIKLYCPELHKKQPIAKGTSDTSSKARDSTRQSGLSTKDNLTVKGSPADPHQVAVIDAVLRAGVRKGATNRMLVCSIMTIIQESEAGARTTGNPPYVGVFQQNPAYWAGTGDPFKDAMGARGKQGFFDALIPAAKADPGGDLGKLAQKVQGADPALNPLNQGYWMSADRWRDESQKAVSKFLGRSIDIDADPTSDDQSQFPTKFEFMVGPDDGPKNENYMAAIYRLATEVNWSAYWVRDVLHYISQEDLFAGKARTRLRRYDQGVESVSFSVDRARKINNMQIQVRMEKWFAPIGTVVVFDEGGPGEGRWLVTDIQRSAFNQLGSITLMKPMREKKEPAHDMSNRSKDSSSSDSAPVTVGDITGTPKDIIDTIVIPIAQSLGKFVSGYNSAPLTPASVENANRHHGHTQGGNISDHEGPKEVRWAADMSIDWQNHPHGDHGPMDALAKALVEEFGFKSNEWNGLKDNSCHSALGHGYQFQICYLMNTAQAGNHFNHVHFGVHVTGQPKTSGSGKKIPSTGS